MCIRDSCTSVNATVAGGVRCRMIYGTVPSSVRAWMPPVTVVTWSPAAACSRLLQRQRGRHGRRWSCATTVEHTTIEWTSFLVRKLYKSSYEYLLWYFQFLCSINGDDNGGGGDDMYVHPCVKSVNSQKRYGIGVCRPSCSSRLAA